MIVVLKLTFVLLITLCVFCLIKIFINVFVFHFYVSLLRILIVEQINQLRRKVFHFNYGVTMKLHIWLLIRYSSYFVFDVMKISCANWKLSLLLHHRDKLLVLLQILICFTNGVLQLNKVLVNLWLLDNFHEFDQKDNCKNGREIINHWLKNCFHSSKFWDHFIYFMVVVCLCDRHVVNVTIYC